MSHQSAVGSVSFAFPLVSIFILLNHTLPEAIAQPAPIGAIAIGADIAIKDILNDAEEKAARLIDRARVSGDMLVAHAGAQLQLVVENLRVAFNDALNKTFSALNEDEKELILNLNRMLDRVGSGVIDKLSDAFTLDCMEVVRHTLLARNLDFYVSSINGCALANGSGTYQIVVAGLGFGYNAEGGDTQSILDVSVNGTTLDFGAVTQQAAHQVTVRFPASMVAADFLDDKVVAVPFVFKCTIFSGRLSTTRKTYKVTVPLLLLPKIAGTADFEEVVDGTGWGNPQTKTITFTIGDEGSEPRDRKDSWTAADNQQITAVTYRPPERNAGFCYSARWRGTPRQYDSDYDITDGGRTVIAYRWMGTSPATSNWSPMKHGN